MRIFFATVMIILGFNTAHAAETRCGWIVNPSPGNWSLIDAKQEWYIAAQGGKQAEGMDLIPDLTEHEWVVTNGGSYGYGCACMSVETSGDEIELIQSFRQIEIRKCTNDNNIPAVGG
jgi:Protein of unknown function (DUF4087)